MPGRPGRGLNIWVTFFPPKVHSAFHPSGVGKIMCSSIHGPLCSGCQRQRRHYILTVSWSKQIIVKRIWACYMEKVLSKTPLYFTFFEHIQRPISTPNSVHIWIYLLFYISTPLTRKGSHAENQASHGQYWCFFSNVLNSVVFLLQLVQKAKFLWMKWHYNQTMPKKFSDICWEEHAQKPNISVKKNAYAYSISLGSISRVLH